MIALVFLMTMAFVCIYGLYDIFKQLKNKTMTAVEWLEYKTQNTKWIDLTLSEKKEIIQQAKEMEKQQIIDAFKSTRIVFAEQYYNETYGSKGSETKQ